MKQINPVALYVAGILALWVGLDYFSIHDTVLLSVLMGLLIHLGVLQKSKQDADKPTEQPKEPQA